jgi:ribosomal protein S6--L-glutamate ligase
MKRSISSVCFIVDRRDHPVIAATAERLALEHRVSIIDAQALRAREAHARPRDPRADVYLLKSRAPWAIQRAREFEARGARVVNTPAATAACRDRVRMARRLAHAGVPCPPTTSFASLLSLRDGQTRPRFPFVVKSRHSRRGDLVAKVTGVAELGTLAPRWAGEPIVVQEFVPGDGWDWKLWMIGGAAAAARRRTTLEEGRGDDLPVQLDRLPIGWLELARKIGTRFGLELYGVDLLATERGPVVVDVNAFPGFRSVPSAPERLASFIDAALEGGSAAGRRVS